MHRITRCVLLAAPILVSCAGDVEAPLSPAGGSTSAPIGARCEAGPPASTPLRRLTKEQYVNSLRDVLGAGLSPIELGLVWSEVAPHIEGLPNDVTTKLAPFASMDNALSDAHIAQFMLVAENAGRAVTANPVRLHNFIGCHIGEPAAQCIEGFLTRLATRAYRRPPNKAELEFLRSVYADNRVSEQAIADAITVVLNAPQFLYQIELGGEQVPDQPGVFQLTDYELANRLALQFWQAPPDEELRRAASAGELRTSEGYEKALDRVLADKRAEQGLSAFISQWLDLESLPPLDTAVGNPVFDAFAGDNKPSGSLRGDMISDVVDSFRFHFDRGDRFSDWLLSPYAFARTDDLASIYGVPKWRGVGVPPTFPEGQRSGLITRAALLATGSANTRPIKKGVLIRERLLCDELPPPDPTAVNAVAQTLSEQRTTREAVEALTEQPNTMCSSCHSTKINGLGFATEGFDALGRTRDHQALFGTDGRELAKRAVNTQTKPFVDDDDSRPVSGAGELATRLAESPKSEQCFARQFVRYAFGRKEAQRGDQCMANEVHVLLEEGQSMKAAVRALALRPEFRTTVIDKTK